jgi:hypothetical protein
VVGFEVGTCVVGYEVGTCVVGYDVGTCVVGYEVGTTGGVGYDVGLHGPSSSIPIRIRKPQGVVVGDSLGD